MDESYNNEEEIFLVPMKITKNAKVTPSIVREIRRAYAEDGVDQKFLSEKFGIGRPAISHIITRRRWAYVN
jgi:hypothetical protein